MLLPHKSSHHQITNRHYHQPDIWYNMCAYIIYLFQAQQKHIPAYSPHKVICFYSIVKPIPLFHFDYFFLLIPLNYHYRIGNYTTSNLIMGLGFLLTEHLWCCHQPLPPFKNKLLYNFSGVFSLCSMCSSAQITFFIQESILSESESSQIT